MTSRKSISHISLYPEERLLVAALDRPPGNRIDRETAAQVRGLCASLREEEKVRVLILTGGPRVFCHGTDPALMTEARSAGSLEELEALVDAYRCASALASLPFPVIAAIEGYAFDQGLELALAADLRVAGASAQSRMGHVADGLVPWDGGTQRLPRVIGPAHAMDLIMTGRTIAATEAEAMGLVNRVVPAGQALAAAKEIAAAILVGGPIAARYAKEVVHTGMDMTLDQGILLETDLTMVLQTTSDRAEGIRSFLEKREPRFKGE
jgi:enoyl-CoA hydratase/carnithine racemase